MQMNRETKLSYVMADCIAKLNELLSSTLLRTVLDILLYLIFGEMKLSEFNIYYLDYDTKRTQTH